MHGSGVDDIDHSAVFEFSTHFQGCMEMFRPLEQVEAYLKNHQQWFARCSEPMQVETLGEDGYIISIGQFGALGYSLIPKFAVMVSPPVDHFYDTHSVPVPGYTPPGYEVDYKAPMHLEEVAIEDTMADVTKFFRKHNLDQCPDRITQVHWDLYLDVKIKFPKFVTRLGNCIIQKTGDRVLSEIIKQISPRLTLKVQNDFHHQLGIPTLPKQSRKFNQVKN
ncbi:MAG: DUF1997 domain-containing protein [Synechococcaceae cyanobacterium RL_1_2]|nr:DUF1997 domain-containing protein [Synechococcaceae cyanobacterium RL_1_2]